MNKTRIGLGIIITLVIVIVIAGYFYFQDTDGENGWTWELKTGESTNITITQEMIDCVGSDEIEDIFTSVYEYLTVIYYYDETQDDNWRSWYKYRTINDLTAIVPGLYYVYVSQDCTLEIC